MNESEVESLFLEALKDLCKMVGVPWLTRVSDSSFLTFFLPRYQISPLRMQEKGDIAVRLPFNVSKINDRMQILSKTRMLSLLSFVSVAVS